MRTKKKIFLRESFKRNTCASIRLALPVRPTRCTSRARLSLLVGREIPARQCRHLTEKPNFTAKTEPIPAKAPSHQSRPKISFISSTLFA